MNLKHLRAFQEVMISGSVSEAARRLHRSQPAVSAMIAGLESELGIELFVRQGKRLHPAPEANFLLREAASILGRVEDVQRTLENVRHTRRGELTIVSMPGPSVYYLPSLIAQFARGRPDLRITLVTKQSSEVERTVSAQNCDLGFGDYDLIASGATDLVTHHPQVLECFCAMSVDDPLTAREVVYATDLDQKPLATLYAEHPTTEQTVRAFETSGSSINPVFRAQYFIALLPIVEQGIAYSIIDALSIRSYELQNPESVRRLTFRPFRPRVVLNTTIMTPAHRAPSLMSEAFLQRFSGELETLANTE